MIQGHVPARVWGFESPLRHQLLSRPRRQPEARVLQRPTKAVIRPGEQSGFVGECLEIPVVTQGQTLDEVCRNLREAVELHLADEDLEALGLSPDPTIIVTMELTPEHAYSKRCR